MASPSPLTEAERAKAAADAERQVRKTLDRHFRPESHARTRAES